ncbi:MAG TPA: hypothetical protein VFO69_01845 [Allosphingosinicella sp.]|nr:hypothetical protein [Allosphingosinicella sp.]
MEKKKALRRVAGGGISLLALAAAAFALAPGPKGRLIALDLDRDGQVANAEIQQSARQRFAALDSNND